METNEIIVHHATENNLKKCIHPDTKASDHSIYRSIRFWEIFAGSGYSCGAVTQGIK